MQVFLHVYLLHQSIHVIFGKFWLIQCPIRHVFMTAHHSAFLRQTAVLKMENSSHLRNLHLFLNSTHDALQTAHCSSMPCDDHDGRRRRSLEQNSHPKVLCNLCSQCNKYYVGTYAGLPYKQHQQFIIKANQKQNGNFYRSTWLRLCPCVSRIKKVIHHFFHG